MATFWQNPDDRTIVLGIDFGTTFTGVAYADSGIPDAIHVIQDWRNDKGGMSPTSKVPTKLCYNSDGSFRWDAQVPSCAPKDDVLEYFKSALDPLHVENLQDGSNLTKKNLQGQDIDYLVTEYLKAVGDHVMQDLVRKFGPVIIAQTPFLIVVTVPAIWSEVAIPRTTNALKRAWRIDSKPSWRVISLTEPEAAALCVLKLCPRHNLNSNDSIMIVDAGGGTVDLITYRIDTLYPKFKIEEAVAGAGGACGAAFLDGRFEQLLVKTLGQEDGFDSSITQGALLKWERVKRRFSMADIQTGQFDYDVTGLADNKSLKVRRARWKLNGVDVFRIFDGILSGDDPVTESQPYFRDFSVISKVNEGRRNRVTLTILRDDVSPGARLEKDHNTQTLCIVEADLSRIPETQIPQRVGSDGLLYYIVDCQIEISYDSASTSYTLLHNGWRYDTVKTESV